MLCQTVAYGVWNKIRIISDNSTINIIRFYHECDGGTEKYILMMTVWHHQAACLHVLFIFLSFPRVGMGFSQMSKTAETSRDIERCKLASLD